jgi:hypothetical protein
MSNAVPAMKMLPIQTPPMPMVQIAAALRTCHSVFPAFYPVPDTASAREVVACNV